MSKRSETKRWDNETCNRQTRSKVSDAILPYMSFIPAGELVDEVGMAIVDYALAKYKSGMTKDIALKGLAIENARVGEYLAQKFMGTSSTNNVSNYTLG